MIVLLFLYAAIFPLLTLDTLTKIMRHIGAFQTGNAFMLVYLEAGRLLTTTVALFIAVWMWTRKRPDARALAVALLFAVIAYEKAFGSNGFPGPMQERLTNTLLEHGAAPALLQWLFGPMAWPLWPALAALLRFSVVFPSPLHADALAASAQQDRRGLMRGAGVAGSDVGFAFRRLSLALFERGAYSPRVLAVAAAVMVALRTIVPWPMAVSLLLAAFVLCIAVINLRAGYLAAEGEDRVRAIWLVEGPLASLFIFLASGTLLLFGGGPTMHTAAFVLIMLVPLTLIVCLALSVLDKGELDTSGILDATIRIGAACWAAVLIFGAVYAVAPLVVAVVVAAISFPFVKRLTDKAGAHILEQQQPSHGGMG